MLVQQISVFIENKNGRLAEVTGILRDNNIDITAISIADTESFGILRMIVDKPQQAVKILNQSGYAVKTTNVMAVEIIDKPGALSRVLELLDSVDISVEYLYSFVRTSDANALILFRVEEPEKAIDILNTGGFKVLTQEQINCL